MVFPSESGAEREGTLTHPDGRIQRVRQAIGHQGEVRPGWRVLAELAERCDAGMSRAHRPAGVRRAWSRPRRSSRASRSRRSAAWACAGPTATRPRGLRAPSFRSTALEQPPELPEGLRLGAAPSLWSGPVSEHAPSLRFLAPGQRAELAPGRRAADRRDIRRRGRGQRRRTQRAGQGRAAPGRAARQRLPDLGHGAGQRDGADQRLAPQRRGEASARAVTGSRWTVAAAPGPGAETPPT
ncbi:MAG: molybdopterin-dependent oxidoreductase [Thermoleophilaceae bacterium]